jgi:hypothetical protein
MQKITNKALAVLLVATTTLGLIVSLFFLIQIWRYRQPVTEKVQSNLIKTSAILKTTNQGLDIIDLAVKNVYTSTVFIDESASTLGQTIQNTNQFVDSASTFVGENLINTITNTQTAINSAQSSAVVIDNILNTLASIPLIGIKYNPSVPLNVALGDVSKSLDPLQVSLLNFQKDLKTTKSNMQKFEGQITLLNKNVIDIKNNLSSTQVVIDNYRNQLKSLQSGIDTAETSLPRWSKNTALILSFIILWFVLIQVGILLQALNSLVGANDARIVEEV